MIVSHEHRFVFVQVPQTGSTAIGKYLVEIAGGQEVLRKHTTLAEARWVLGRSIRGYRVVATVRNPVDQVVSSYYKLRTDHHQQLVTQSDVSVGPKVSRRLQWARAPERTLEEFLETFVSRVFAPVHVRSLRRADVLLRFERLDASVAELFAFLEMPEAGLLPRRNETDRPAGIDFGPTAARHLADRCGPFMTEFGYTMEEPVDSFSAAHRTRRRIEYDAAIALKSLRRLRNLKVLAAKDPAAGY